jgi:HSP20 family protein
MTLIRWTPIRGMTGFQDEMNRLFNEFFASTPDRGETGVFPWNPLVDIAETKDDIVVKAEIPGMKKDDIKIVIQDNILTLKGERQEEKQEKDKRYHRVERSYGSFERSFSLPVSVKVDKVKADYKDGVLTITLPKAEEAKPKEVSVNIS